MKKFLLPLTIGAFLVSLSLTGCTKYAKDKDLQQLSEQKAATEAAEKSLADKQVELDRLEKELADKKAELQEVKTIREEIEKKK